MPVTNDRAREMVDDLITYNISLNPWEEQFTADMDDKEDYTEMEINKIEEIHGKHC